MKCLKILIFFMTCLGTSFAGSSQSRLLVSCRVVKGESKVEFQTADQEVMLRKTTYVNDNVAKIGEFQIDCAEGTAVKVTYDMAFYDRKTLEELPLPAKHPAKKVYTDQQCTEVWEPGREVVFTYNKQKRSHIGAIYCKNIKRYLQPNKNQPVLLMTVNINY